MRLSTASHRRSGTVLVLFAMIDFGLLGLAALVIDLGLARVSQRQMQSAADTAALEGLRFRDDPNVDARTTAKISAGLVFTGTGTPQIPLKVGIGDLNASSKIDPSSLYDPTAGLELNRNNVAYGDMVAGNFKPDSLSSAENNSYDRLDFDPVSGGNSFLVRLRRTNDKQGLDNQPTVSSAGPTLPFLFGRGSVMHRDPTKPYNPRSDGITIRATAIADARPVLSVGPPVESLPGHTPFAIQVQNWNGLGTGLVNLNVDDINAIFLDPSSNPRTIGDALTSGGVPSVLVTGYVPVFDTVAGQKRIVGFGDVRDPSLAGTTLSFTIPTEPKVAARNVLTVPLALDSTLMAEDVNALFRYLFDTDPAFPHVNIPLKAPALVNRYLGPPS